MASLFLLLFSFSSITASASEIEKDVNGVGDINLEEYFRENHVPTEKQSILLEKIENYELWDVYKAENLEKVPSDFFKFNYFDGDQTRYYRFEDGSFISIGVEKGGEKYVSEDKLDPNVIIPFGSWNHGDYIDVWDYKVQKIVGTASATFYADFEVGLPGFRASKITNLYGANASGFGVTGTPSTEIVRATEDTTRSRSALARSYWYSQADLSFSWEYGFASGGSNTTIGTTCSLWLAVVNGSIYVDSKLPY